MFLFSFYTQRGQLADGACIACSKKRLALRLTGYKQSPAGHCQLFKHPTRSPPIGIAKLSEVFMNACFTPGADFTKQENSSQDKLSVSLTHSFSQTKLSRCHMFESGSMSDTPHNSQLISSSLLPTPAFSMRVLSMVLVEIPRLRLS